MQRENPSITIGGHVAGLGRPLFVIAEIGLNHGGSVDRALAMVDAAASAGVAAVKLQTLEAASLVAPSCPAPAHVDAQSLTEFFATFELDEEAHRLVAARARERGVAFISTPFSIEAVSLLERTGVDAFKIASGDLTWDALIERVAQTGKPIIMSTGMASFDEVAHAVTIARLAGAREVALLHCVSAYPVPEGAENLQVIDTLRRSFNVPAGLSDHAPDTFSVAIAVTYGACIYERHLVLEGDSQAIDAAVSSTPQELVAVASCAARALLSLGDGVKACLPSEAPNVVPSRRSLYTRTALQRGTTIEPSHLVALRPGNALSPNRLPELVGRVLACNLPAGAALRLEHLQADDSRATA
jgi:sialic acid synthase SpsE